MSAPEVVGAERPESASGCEAALDPGIAIGDVDHAEPGEEVGELREVGHDARLVAWVRAGRVTTVDDAEIATALDALRPIAQDARQLILAQELERALRNLAAKGRPSKRS